MFSFFKNALGAKARFASTFSASHRFLGLLQCRERKPHQKERAEVPGTPQPTKRAEESATRQASTPTAAARRVSTLSHSEIKHTDG